MNIKNWLTLTIRTVDFNIIATRPPLVEKLRKLTLSQHSGLNYEMDRMLEDVKERQVACQVFLAYRFKTLVGWAILSEEESNFNFMHNHNGFKKEDGYLFQVFINPNYRRQGIASELYKAAQKKSGKKTMCICPWNESSEKFYNNFVHFNTKRL